MLLKLILMVLALPGKQTKSQLVMGAINIFVPTKQKPEKNVREKV
jgi:hypothetical protein